MDRRRFLATLAGVGSLGGCLGAPRAAPEASQTPAEPPGRYGFPPDICSEAEKDDPGIYAITDPVAAFDWGGHETDERYRRDGHAGLAPDQIVIGVRAGSAARAYPLSVLWYHETVNDILDGQPLLVTYCPLCRSGMVADRRIASDVATFRVSGLLWAAPQLQEAIAEREGRVFGANHRGETTVRHSGNVVIIDDITGSYWSQILATAICGPLARQTLSIVPSTVTTWREWQQLEPDTDVLLPPPHSGTVSR